MLADLDDSLQQLIKATLPIRNGEIDVKFDQPKREWSAKLNKPTLNLFLYDVRENVTLRNHQWHAAPANGKTSPTTGAQKRTPYRFDCTYLLTAWASESDDEHRLLSRAILALLQTPLLPEAHRVESLRLQPFEIPLRLGVHDKLTNPAEIWSSLDNEVRPTLPLIVTLAFDPWQPVSGPIVRSYTIRGGQTDSLPQQTALRPNGLAFESHYIGGTLRHKQGGTINGVTVALKNTGYLTQTSADGNYILGGVPSGDYTLIAWSADGKPHEKKITIPAKDGDYDLTIN